MDWQIVPAVMLGFILACTPAYAEGIEVVYQDAQPEMAPVETDKDEQVQPIEILDSIGDEKVDAKEEKTEEQAETERIESESDTKATEDVEEKREEQPVEDYPSPLGGTRAPISVTAYTNANATSQYAHYAEGLLKEVPLDGHYVFLQDTNLSYIFVVGKADDVASFTDAKWWRWYSVQGYGYRLERGNGTVSVSSGGYTVLSDLEGWPSLIEERGEVEHREIQFFVVTAMCCYVIARIWRWSMRLANGSVC